MQVATVNNINNTSVKKKLWKNPVRDTGYAAAVFGISSGIAGAKKKIKLHKYLAYIAGIFTLAHLGIVEYYKHMKKSSKN